MSFHYSFPSTLPKVDFGGHPSFVHLSLDFQMHLPPQQYGLIGTTTIPYQLRYVFEVLTHPIPPHFPHYLGK